MNSDILRNLFHIETPDIELINNIVLGNRQVAVLLNNNQLGSCTTLGYNIQAKKENLINPDFNNISHRALLIAYYNAYFNNLCFNGGYDITDIVDFSIYKNVVMIGYFRTLVEKLDHQNIPLHVFDLENKSVRLSDMKEQEKYVKEADCLIITATTLLNNSLDKLACQSHANSDIFLLGPTSILHPKLFEIKNLKYVFGSVFSDNEKALNIIKEGGGIKDITKYLKKTYLKRP